MKFDPKKYETVKQRKERFYQDHPDGRIIVKNVTPIEQAMEYALFTAYIYENKEDQKANLPKSTGYAMEVRDKELSISKYGSEYEGVNYSSWTENCEESAVGRALDNAGYSGNKKCSLEEMQKATKMNKTMKQKNENEKNLSFIRKEISKKANELIEKGVYTAKDIPEEMEGIIGIRKSTETSDPIKLNKFRDYLEQVIKEAK
jgi:hypothetical protein